MQPLEPAEECLRAAGALTTNDTQRPRVTVAAAAAVTDPGSLIPDATISVMPDPADASKKVATLDATFSESMGKTNMAIRVEGSDGRISTTGVLDALIVGTPSWIDPEPTASALPPWVDPGAHAGRHGRSPHVVRL